MYKLAPNKCAENKRHSSTFYPSQLIWENLMYSVKQQHSLPVHHRFFALDHFVQAHPSRLKLGISTDYSESTRYAYHRAE